MANLTDLVGQLIGNSAPGPNSNPVDINQTLGTQYNGQTAAPLPSLQGDPAPLTGDAAARPFTHYETVKKHGLHELLSIAGDMALSSAGLQPQYLPSLHTAKIADALEGFQDDPSGAINRLTGVDPAAAEALYNDTIQNTYKRALTGQSIAMAQKEAQESVQNTDIYKQKVFSAAASMVNAASPQTYAAVRKRAVDFLVARGASQFADGLPESYNKDLVESWANGAVPVDKQVDNERQNAAQEETARHNLVDEGISAENAGTSAANSKTQSRNVDDEISYRAWQKQHGDAGENRRKDYEEWLKNHPSKQRGGTPTNIPVGYKNSNGLTYQGGDINNRANWK